MPDGHSVSAREIAHFDKLAATWWDASGSMRVLHAMNPLRTSWIEQRLEPLKQARGGPLSLLDIGCGAGLASEAFAKMGLNVLGLDASKEAIAAAAAHQEQAPLPATAGTLSYRAGSAEDLVSEGAQFDVVTALEVIEHVTDPQAFLKMLSTLTRPGGSVAISTLNRTLRSFTVAKVGAEYLARLLPVGTHDWRKFIRPDELSAMGRKAGLRMTDVAGMTFIPPRWRATRDTGVNYIAIFTRD